MDTTLLLDKVTELLAANKQMPQVHFLRSKFRMVEDTMNQPAAFHLYASFASL